MLKRVRRGSVVYKPLLRSGVKAFEEFYQRLVKVLPEAQKLDADAVGNATVAEFAEKLGLSMGRVAYFIALASAYFLTDGAFIVQQEKCGGSLWDSYPTVWWTYVVREIPNRPVARLLLTETTRIRDFVEQVVRRRTEQHAHA